MAQETETPRADEAALFAARQQAMQVVLPQGIRWADAAAASVPERPPLDLGTIPPDMANEAAEILERYRNDPSYDARSAVADFKTLTEMKKAEIIHLQQDAHSAEEKREKLWESVRKSMEVVDQLFSKLDPYLTDEERQKRAELDKAFESAKTEEEREEAARRKQVYEQALAGRAKERAHLAGDGEGVAAAEEAEDKLRKRGETLNQLTEQRIMADNTMSAEEKQERIAIEKAKVANLVASGDSNGISEQIEQQSKPVENNRQHHIPAHIAEHVAVAMEVAPTGFIYQEASAADNKEPVNTASSRKSNVTVVSL